MDVEIFDVILGEILNLIFVLIGVAFVTLLERRVLGYVQLRRGPNKVGVFGVVQPFSDAIRLFTRGYFGLIIQIEFLYLIRPLMGLCFFFFVWCVYPIYFGGLDYVFGLIYFFCLRRLMVYVLFLCGWSSGSVYSMLGSVRGVAQMISYEVRLIFIVLGCIFIRFSFDLEEISIKQCDL